MICIIDCGTSWVQEIKQQIKKLGYKSKVIKLKKIEKTDFKSFSGIIISGAPTHLSKVNLQKYLKPFHFVRNIKIPVLGICLGHQIVCA